MRIHGPEAVRALLDMPGCIAAVRDAMRRFSAEALEQPLRSITPIGEGRLFALMPGMLAVPDGFGTKVISVYADPERPQRAKHRGVVLLFDRETGELQCIADAGEITEIRTAAASAVATDALARLDAHSLAIFGSGSQARSHLRAIPLVRDLDEILVWGRSRASAEMLIAEVQPELTVPIRFVADAREAAQADILCTVTSSTTPILLGEWVRPGTHVNVVGSSYPGPVEVDHVLVLASRYIVDSRRSALAAAAEFLDAKAAGLIGDAHIVAEIGEVLLDSIPGRTDDDQITLYKSLGHIVQDLAATAYVDAASALR